MSAWRAARVRRRYRPQGRTSKTCRASVLVALLLLAGCRNGPSYTAQAPEQTPGPTDESAPIGPVTDDLLRTGHQGRPDRWPTYGGDWAQTRYSPLTQVRRDTVLSLDGILNQIATQFGEDVAT